MPITTPYTAESGVQPGATFDPSTLAGKSVLITGGASGIGETIARAFVKNGAFVTIGDINESRGVQLVSELGGESKAAFAKCNVLTWADQVGLFKTALEKSPCKSLDIVVANAGIGTKEHILEDNAGPGDEPVEPDLSVLRVNLVGVQYTAHLAVHYLTRQPDNGQRDRCLIMTSSISGYLDHLGSPQYCASKWGVRGMMRSLRRALPETGMRVNIIAPWLIHTPIISEELLEYTKSKGITYADVSDAASAVLHIASDRSVNGRALAIVTRDLDSRGYMDINADNDGEDLIGNFQSVLF